MELIKCLECGKDMKRITNTHLENCCGLSIDEYKEKYPEALIESKELAMSRVSHLRGKTYEEIYGENKGSELRQIRKEDAKIDWETNPTRLEQKENKILQVLEKLNDPPLIGRPRKNYKDGLCKNCGIEFEYRTSDHNGSFCSKDCHLDYVKRNAKNYRIKAFANLPNICDICGATEKLIVHHKDKNRRNNDLNNLQIICTKCHNKEHADDCIPNRGVFSEPAIARGMVDILHGLKVDITDANFFETPKRVAKAYREIFEGLLPEALEELEENMSKTFPCDYDELITVKDIQCWSMCPHHFLPVKYTISLGYIPNGKVLGISKLPRLVTLLAKRPVLQEQLTKDIVDYLEKSVSPKGIMVVISGRHLCMEMRGVKAHDSSTMTSSISGIFKDNFSAKMELLHLISLGNNTTTF